MESLFSFLTLKKDVAYLEDEMSIRQAIEKMEYHRYSVIPILERGSGKYLTSISEGDILFYLKNRRIEWEETEKKKITVIQSIRPCKSCSVYESFEVLSSLILNQNFVPIVDDKGVFIGIITRKRILEELSKTHR